MSQPTFTVAMPAYNAAATVGSAIRSVLAQTRDDFELVIADDGSTDGTSEEVARFDDPRVRLLREGRKGLARARNAAVGAGTGRYVCMLDSDDLWLPCYLEAMEAALVARPDAGLAYTDAWVLDDATRRIQRVTAMHYQDPPAVPPARADAFLRLLLERNFVFTAATVPRTVLEEVGGFRPELAASEDYELWLRIAARGYGAVRPPGVLAVYRKRAGSVSTSDERMVVGMRDAFRIVAGEYDLPPELRTRARERVSELEARLAGLRGEGGARPRVHRARARAVRLKGALLRPVQWRRRPPPEVAAAFPDLRAV